MNQSEQPRRIPRRAKKGRRYVKMPMPDYRNMLGKIEQISMYFLHAMLHNSRFRRNTRGCRQYVNIMVRHGQMKRPVTRRRQGEAVMNHEQKMRMRERIINDVENFLAERKMNTPLG